MIPLGNWEPDSYVVNDGKVLTAENVLPVANGWGPCPGVEELSSSLGEKCVGGVSVRTSANSYQIYAGTQTAIYKYDSGTLGWTDVSGAITFSVPDGDYWSFALFGDYLLATNLADGLHEIDLLTGGATFAATAGSPPKARFVDVAGDFVVLGCLENANNALHWSALNDRTEWTTGTNFSDTQTFPDGGAIRGMACQEAGIVFQEDTVRRMTLVGGSQIFTFSVLARNRRLRAPYSVVALGSVVYAMMETGLCAYTQAQETAVGVGRIDRWLRSYADAEWFPRILGCVDPTNTRVYWAFRSADGSGNDWHDCILVLDTNLQRFSLIRRNVDVIFPAATAGFTLESLDAFGTMETLTTSLDSAAWGGGIPNWGQIGSSHKLGFATAEPIAGEVITTDRQLGGASRALVTGVYPYTDCGAIAGAVAGKATPAEAATYPVAVSTNVMGLIPVRVDGRFHSVKLNFPAGATWTYANGIDLDYAGSGRR